MTVPTGEAGGYDTKVSQPRGPRQIEVDVLDWRRPEVRAREAAIVLIANCALRSIKMYVSDVKVVDLPSRPLELHARIGSVVDHAMVNFSVKLLLD